jgi:RNA polymerase sigma factor (sigma-70 family)
MPDGQRSDVLRHVRKFLDAQGLERLPDGQLLERFLSRQEETAFAVLVRRHGPMVLGVCRRVLHDGHAAEDAFQATFLVLFRRARTLDRRGSLANWLYTVAYHIALKARADTAQRRRRERLVGEMSQVESHPEEVWRDLQPVLDEELNSLPDKYRAPILLCYLQGKTNEEAARLLGWPIGTVKGRLSRARELLRARLTRRGITLSTGFLGVVLTEHASAAVPGLLVHSTVKTIALLSAGKVVAGMSAASAAALAEGVLKAMFVTKMKIATAFLFAVGVFGMGVGIVAQQGLVQQQSPALLAEGSKPLSQTEKKTPATLSAEEKKMAAVTGKVLDADGKPVAYADVAVLGRPISPLRSRLEDGQPGVALGQGKTDGDGHFHLIVAQTSKERFWTVCVFARAPGRALGWQQLDPDLDHALAEIRLPRERILRGRLIDLQGQPVTNVKLQVVRIVGPPPQRYRPLLKADRPPGGLACLPEPVTTDAQGRFQLCGLDGTLTVTLELLDAHYARQELEISPLDKGGRGEATFVLAPARTLEGTVVYEDTGKPVPKARLTVQTHEGAQEYDRSYQVESQTDEQGRFQVILHAGNYVTRDAAQTPAGTARMPPPIPSRLTASYTIAVYPPAGTPYLAICKGMDWPKVNLVKHAIHVALPRGVVVRGTVTEGASGKPVAGAHIAFKTYESNHSFLSRRIWEPTSSSGPDGTFQLTILPGPGHLLINGPTLDYLHVEIADQELYGNESILPDRRFYPDALVPLNLKPDAGPHEVAVTLRRGVTLSGRVVGLDGKRVAQAEMICRSYIPYGYWSSGRSKEVKNGRFELPGCDPEKTTEVFFFDAKNRLGTVAQLSGKAVGKPVTVVLQPCGSVTARILNDNGKPAADFQVDAEFVITPGVFIEDVWPPSPGSKIEGPAADIGIGSRAAADPQGRVTLPSLIPGATYRLVSARGAITVHKEFKVAPGQILDLGDITIKPRKRG